MLLSGKSALIYNKAFKILKEICSNDNILLYPSTIITDMKTGLMKSVAESFIGKMNFFEIWKMFLKEIKIFLGTDHKICLFHLYQAIFKKLIVMKLKEKYNTEAYFNMKIHKLLALAYFKRNRHTSSFYSNGF